MLTGQELLSFVKANVDMSRTEVARATGYVKTTENGTERLLISKLNEALLEAKGLKLKAGKKPGKAARYITTVHTSGAISLGKTYSRKFGLEPGDALHIDIQEDAIRLVPLPADKAKAAT